MKKTYLLIFVAYATMAAVLTSCELPVLDDDLQKEQYVREFVREFGIADPGHTWCMATPATLRVTGATGQNIKVYARGADAYHIVASYASVDGMREMNFDIPSGCDDLLVDMGGRRMKCRPGDTVSPTGVVSRDEESATVFPGNTIHCGEMTISAGDRYKVFCTDMLLPVNSFINPDKVDEDNPYDRAVEWSFEHNGNIYTNTNSRVMVPEDEVNTAREGLHFDFMYESKGTPVYLYPIYWDKNMEHNFGIYFVDENGNWAGEHLIYLDEAQQTNQSMYMIRCYDREQTHGDCKFWGEYNIINWLNNSVKLKNEHNDPLVFSAIGTEGATATIETILEMETVDGVLQRKHDGEQLVIKPYYLEQINAYVRTTHPGPYFPSGCALAGLINPETNDIYRPVGHENELTTVAISDRQSGNINMEILAPFWYPATMLQSLGFDEMGVEKFDNANSKQMSYELYTGKPRTIATQAIKIEAPAGYRFGFYQLYNGLYAYSSTAVQFGEESGHQVVDNNGQSWCTTFKEPIWGNTYLAFEDHFASNGIMDYNDIIFMIEGEAAAVDPHSGEILIPMSDPDPGPGPGPGPGPDPGEVPVVDTPFEYIYAAEDMGSIGDWDFNDVVFGVTVISGDGEGTDRIKVQPLAAGGTLETYLYLGDTQIGGEWHALFGASVSTMVNTFNGRTLVKPSAILERKPEGWTISSGVNFRIKVIDTEAPDGRWITTSTIADREDDAVADVPQILIVAGGWKWPAETKKISIAYPHFNDWVNDRNNSTWQTQPSSNTSLTINWK